VSYVAVELARKIFGELKDKNVLLVGAGKMSELAAKAPRAQRRRATVLGGRTFEKAAELAAALGGKAAPLRIAARRAGARGHRHQRHRRLRHRHPPRGRGERARGAAAGATRAPLPDRHRGAARHRPRGAEDRGRVPLRPRRPQGGGGANLRERLKESAAAEALVEREVREFLDWQKAREVVPLLNELRRRAEEIRRHELEKARRASAP
jgi:glutamyl-tRNA reductase